MSLAGSEGGSCNPCGTALPHAISQALGCSDLTLPSIIIFTNSTAIAPGSSAIIIMLSLLLIILIISINYKQEWGTAGRSREAGTPLGGHGGADTGLPSPLPTSTLSCFWPRPSVPSSAWPRDIGGSRWPFPARVPEGPGHLRQSPSMPPRSYFGTIIPESRSKLIFQLLRSCNHGDGSSSITCLSLLLKDSRGRNWRRQRAETTDTAVRGERDTESNGHGDPQRQREMTNPGELKAQRERDDSKHHRKDRADLERQRQRQLRDS